MKKTFSFFVFLALALSGLFFLFNEYAKPVSGQEISKNFLVQKGAGASQIGIDLKKAGLIRSQIAFKVYIQLTSQSGKLQSGEFRLSPSMNLFEIVKALQSGPIEFWVTIPEGLRREEVAAKFAQSLEKNDAFVSEFISLSKNKEGYLFPDTYLFPKEATAKMIVDSMLLNFENKTQGLNLTYDQVILASMIERETKTDAERPVVAGIIMNRIDNNWPLQIDATNQYGVGTPKNWWPILTLDDIEKPSAYNTYKNLGFPPTPIANAGISSLKAAANPQDSEYFFYIHAPNGQIHYAKTLSEHNANIKRYLGK